MENAEHAEYKTDCDCVYGKWRDIWYRTGSVAWERTRPRALVAPQERGAAPPALPAREGASVPRLRLQTAIGGNSACSVISACSAFSFHRTHHPGLI
jgi:hypothetical protein